MTIACLKTMKKITVMEPGSSWVYYFGNPEFIPKNVKLAVNDAYQKGLANPTLRKLRENRYEMIVQRRQS